MGGIEISAEKAGFETILQVEPDRACIKVLEREWPDVPRIKYVQEIEKIMELINESVTLISGGDPCPIRSRARGNRPTRHADLSGYFLAVVGQVRPRWVFRENVLAPDVVDFETALDVLGYRAVIVRTNAASYTGQNRIRDIIVGCIKEAGLRRFIKLFEQYSGSRDIKKMHKKAEGYPCLTTHAYRYDPRDGYIWDGQGAMRVADSEERERLAGFSIGWLDGLPRSTVARLTGNAVVPAQIYPILKAIAEIEKNDRNNS